MPHQLGKIIYRNGDRLQIVGEPYELFGYWWQDATDENGKVFAVPTPEQQAKNEDNKRREWKEQQEGFSRLHKAQQGAKTCG